MTEVLQQEMGMLAAVHAVESWHQSCHCYHGFCWCLDESHVPEALAQGFAAQSMIAGHPLRDLLLTCLLMHSSCCVCHLMLRTSDCCN